MASFNISALTLGLAALSSALPHPKRALSDSEFYIGLQTEGYPYLTLNAVQSSTLGTMNLFFQRPSVYTGTPAYLNNTYLNFDISGTPYAMDFVSVGDDHGYSVPVTAVFSATQENGRAGFSVSSDGEVQATLTAATQGFFACKRTLEDAGPVEMEGLTLNWGIFQEDGSAPEGCVFAGLKTAMVPD